MSDRTLRDCRVLVVEDEYMLADELRIELESAGALVIGPLADLADATAVINANQRIDGAILDANLAGEMVFPAADLLMARDVPIVFTTGYDVSVIPARFNTVARCEKPINMKAISDAIGRKSTS